MVGFSSFRGCKEKLCTFLHDEFICVALPRQLVIQNFRLGVLFKALQLIFLLMMIFYCIHGEVWRRQSTPFAWGFSAWSEGPPQDAVLQPNAAHCTDSRSYHFNQSRQLKLQPRGCRALSVDEASTKAGNGAEVFITTLVQDRAVWHGSGAACGGGTGQACSGAAGRFESNGGTCTCTTDEEYFAQDAEEQQLFFSHGYEVDTSNGAGYHIIRGSSLSMRVQEGPRGQQIERDGQLTTVFQKNDGSPCKVGGKTEWTNEESLGGISGTLREFLACAGLDLDASPRSLLAASGLAPHVRTMGLSLELHLEYQNSLWSEGVTCYVRVYAVPVWTWKQSTDVVKVPIAGGQLTKKSRRVFGVAVSMKAVGQFYTFDFTKLITAFASLLVMLQVPRYLTQFIALYCLGLMSTIYRNAKRAKLNIFEHFHGACARMMLAEIGFRGLMGGIWRGKVADMPGLTEKHLHRQLKSIFHEPIKNGILQAGELRKMANVIFSKMDLGKNGTITCSDFISSCSANDTIDIHSMARFFDDDKKVGFVQSYFDDTDEMRRMHTSSVMESDVDFDDDVEEGGSSAKSSMVLARIRRSSLMSDGMVNGMVSGTIASGRSTPRGRRSVTSVSFEDGSPGRVVRTATCVLEADDVRMMLAEGLETLEQRLKRIEDLSLKDCLATLEKRVDKATSKAIWASRFAMRLQQAENDDDDEVEVRPPMSQPMSPVQRRGSDSLAPSRAMTPEDGASPSPPRTSGDALTRHSATTESGLSVDSTHALAKEHANKLNARKAKNNAAMLALSTKVQELEEGVSLLHANLEARTSQLEELTMVRAPASTVLDVDVKRQAVEISRAFEDRLRKIEAAVSRSQTVGLSSPQPLPQPAPPTWQSPRDKNEVAESPEREHRIHTVSRTLSKLSMPSVGDQDRDVGLHPPDQCLASSLKHVRGTSAPAGARGGKGFERRLVALN